MEHFISITLDFSWFTKKLYSILLSYFPGFKPSYIYYYYNSMLHSTGFFRDSGPGNGKRPIGPTFGRKRFTSKSTDWENSKPNTNVGHLFFPRITTGIKGTI